MPNKVIIIPEPTEATKGLYIKIIMTDSGPALNVYYALQGQVFTADINNTDLTAVQKASLANLVSAIITLAKPKMGF